MIKIIFTQIIKTLNKVYIKLFGIQSLFKLFDQISTNNKFNPLVGYYKNIGILNSGNIYQTGESFFIEKIVNRYLSKNNLVFFDVGANIGDYSLFLNQIYPQAQIHAFEPNPNAFKKLSEKTKIVKNIIANNYGLGEEKKQIKLYSYKKMKNTQLGTCKKDILNNLFDVKDQIISHKINIQTLDYYCNERKIEKIDLLKIDVEGYELAVLKGAKKILPKTRIIQFEFNEYNIFYKIFLKDFYDLLYPQFQLFRLDLKRLIPLGGYQTINEIFKFQNIIAINQPKYD
ncbi:FkbM family methyltransferase [Candidatus Beckwithbacteria bacterium]|nr:FkbM family methyltransferase [Candidatus Beckwithbacteria bacterium]